MNNITKIYALVDCNNFYVSCERIFKPWLNKTPIIVLSNNDGCVISRSQEAKNIGIKMGQPAFEIEDIINKNKIKVFSSNYTLYGDISKRVMKILSSFTPKIEFYSIDEVFLSLDGFKNDLVKNANKIKNTVFQHTGIPVCVGIGPTKTLAKVANHIAKKFKFKISNTGVFYIQNINDIEFWLKKISIGDIWGIGRQYKYFLNKNNINSTWDFLLKNDEWIKKNLTINGLRIKKELLGYQCNQLELEHKTKKSIATTRSFANMINNYNDLSEAVSNFASKCAFKLRKDNLLCNIIILFIQTNKHRKNLCQYNKNIILQFDEPTNSTIEITKKALNGLKIIFKDNLEYKKAGVIATEIVKDYSFQSSFLTNINRIKHNNLMQALDKTNFRYDKNKVKIASQGSGKAYKLKQDKISKAYTTRWDDILEIY